MAKYYNFNPDIECKYCGIELETKDLVDFRCPNCNTNLYGCILAKMILDVQPMQINPMVPTAEQLEVSYRLAREHVFNDYG